MTSMLLLARVHAARHLPKMDLLSETDAWVKVSCRDQLARTATIMNDPSPRWETLLVIPVVLDEAALDDASVRLEIWDADLVRDEPIAWHELTLGAVELGTLITLSMTLFDGTPSPRGGDVELDVSLSLQRDFAAMCEQMPIVGFQKRAATRRISRPLAENWSRDVVHLSFLDDAFEVVVESTQPSVQTRLTCATYPDIEQSLRRITGEGAPHYVVGRFPLDTKLEAVGLQRLTQFEETFTDVSACLIERGVDPALTAHTKIRFKALARALRGCEKVVVDERDRRLIVPLLEGAIELTSRTDGAGVEIALLISKRAALCGVELGLERAGAGASVLTTPLRPTLVTPHDEYVSRVRIDRVAGAPPPAIDGLRVVRWSVRCVESWTLAELF